MEELGWPMLSGLAFTLLGAAYFFHQQRNAQRTVARWKRQYTEYSVAACAKRLGLTIVEGDPGYNLCFGHLGDPLSRTGASEFRVRLEGSPGDRRTAFKYTYRPGELHATLSVVTDVPVPSFEVLLRRPQYGPPLEHALGLPAHSFGDPTLDRHFALYSEDPSMGARLAGPVALLLAEGDVCVQGCWGRVEFRLNGWGLSAALAHPELTLFALQAVAGALDGRATRVGPQSPPGLGDAELRAKLELAELAERATAGRGATLDAALQQYRAHRRELGLCFGVMALYLVFCGGPGHIWRGLGHAFATACMITGCFGGWWASRRTADAASRSAAPAPPTRCAGCGGEVPVGDTGSLPCPYCGAPSQSRKGPVDESRAYAERAAEENVRAAAASPTVAVVSWVGALAGLAVGYTLHAALTLALSAIGRLAA